MDIEKETDEDDSTARGAGIELPLFECAHHYLAFTVKRLGRCVRFVVCAIITAIIWLLVHKGSWLPYSPRSNALKAVYVFS